MLERIFNKFRRELYLFAHPHLWGHKVQINGIPNIGNMNNLVIGDNVSLNSNCYIQCVGGVELNDCVTISYGCVILTSGLDTNDYMDKCTAKFRNHIVKPVIIGKGVWLGANSMVMPGVTIAPGVIVAAGSVVTKNLDKSGFLYGGIPAKPIKSLSNNMNL